MGCGEMKFSWLCLALIIVPNLGGWIGGIAVSTNTATEWYKGLNKVPVPAWVFGPIWTIMYCLMGLASYLVWEERKSYLRSQTPSNPESHELPSNEAKPVRTKSRFSTTPGFIRRKSWLPIAIYIAQLILNWAWVWIFFEFHAILWGLIEIFLLDLTVAVCLVCFTIVRLSAGALLIPYMAWLIFATYLNFYIYLKN